MVLLARLRDTGGVAVAGGPDTTPARLPVQLEVVTGEVSSVGVGNAGQGSPADAWIQPGRIPAPQSTGAGTGSQGITAAESGAPLTVVGVRSPFDSSQAAADMVAVNVGDT